MKYFEVLFYNGKLDHVEYRGVPALTYMFVLDEAGFESKWSRVEKRQIKPELFLTLASKEDLDRFYAIKCYDASIDRKLREKKYLYSRRYTMFGTNLNARAIAEKLNSECKQRKNTLKRMFGDLSFLEIATMFVEHAKDMIKHETL